MNLKEHLMKTIFCIFAGMMLQLSSSFTQVFLSSPTVYRQSPTSSVVYFNYGFNDSVNSAIKGSYGTTFPVNNTIVNKKSKSEAFVFSLFPGGGQFYTDQIGKGLIVIGGMGACALITINSIQRDFNSKMGEIMILVGVGIYIYSFIDAQSEVDSINSRNIGFKYNINPRISLNIKPYFVSYTPEGVFNPEAGISISTPIH